MASIRTLLPQFAQLGLAGTFGPLRHQPVNLRVGRGNLAMNDVQFFYH